MIVRPLFSSMILLLIIPFLASAQKSQRKIVFPDTKEWKTLKCDFHIHTVFSDGSVWPDIRVGEAVRDGLDAISLTEHIEYQPHKDDIPHPDRNRSFNLAKEAAKAFDLLIIRGAEITRKMPPGHANAVFIQDANKLVVSDSLEAYREASNQGAFIFWNHPNWVSQQRNGIPFISEFHKMLIKENLLHGIEVVNDVTYSEEAVDDALRYGLCMLGTSDIHGLVDWSFGIADGGHRPITLVFAENKSEEAIKEALFAGRTVAWFDNMLIGKQENILPLVKSSLVFRDKGMLGRSDVHIIEIENRSSASYVLDYTGKSGFYMSGNLIEIKAFEKKELHFITQNGVKASNLKFQVRNAVIAYKKTAEIDFEIEMTSY